MARLLLCRAHHAQGQPTARTARRVYNELLGIGNAVCSQFVDHVAQRPATKLRTRKENALLEVVSTMNTAGENHMRNSRSNIIEVAVEKRERNELAEKDSDVDDATEIDDELET